MKKIYGLLGRDIGYSFSKGFFTEKFTKENLDCEYNNFDLKQIESFKEIINDPSIQGLNVTIPYKEEIVSYLDNLDTVAKEIGAVNVIKFEKDKKLTGFNSDYYGFTEALKPLLNKSIKKALILGTGGASKAIAYALDKLGITHTFVSRNPDFNELSYIDLDEDIMNEYKLVINCTPLGTHPNIEDFPNIPYEYITKNHVFFDLIYNPAETTFMKKGKEKGAKVSNGLQMLILQAQKSWEIWNS
ncbi:shikimate dehydrogenase [Aquimarina sp. AD10]|uniref:shikimate dehydrogenase family protein n=1 Tax=Aquimarina sp. AD10 TaxID=1714849 RepID=UPI000E54B19C|nr:shikimate dehydrogenase [Aquimarina sp. AD10]AXT63442.1 shikimate dehydrogenase [Aquimarina sp. AD10]RKN00546.1 shikimate dehydrogenase [Aquimarina sp. AD10]